MNWLERFIEQNLLFLVAFLYIVIRLFVPSPYLFLVLQYLCFGAGIIILFVSVRYLMSDNYVEGCLALIVIATGFCVFYIALGNEYVRMKNHFDVPYPCINIEQFPALAVFDISSLVLIFVSLAERINEVRIRRAKLLSPDVDAEQEESSQR